MNVQDNCKQSMLVDDACRFKVGLAHIFYYPLKDFTRQYKKEISSGMMVFNCMYVNCRSLALQSNSLHMTLGCEDLYSKLESQSFQCDD